MEIDNIVITTDGASVVVKVRKHLPCYQQLCYSHSIQLAVVDVLYNKKPHKEVEQVATDEKPAQEDIIELEEDGLDVDAEPVKMTLMKGPRWNLKERRRTLKAKWSTRIRKDPDKRNERL
ncbi:hypothetical protein HHI36_002683 [Cryptolaemus montrouzieri]|uniref:Uncharacterized protein n=1 Tax=Cryptolaemus montrouzieri TaxID=559131 RepID=A0ABD2PBP1_9CUCU